MAYEPDPEFRKLYTIFTADPGSIGARLNASLGRLSDDAPLLVATGTDLVIFPGGGRAPVVESFRLSTRGFIELTAISHLGIAVPYLIRLKELGDPAWASEARRLIEQMARVKGVNTVAYWRDTVAVAAWRGLEEKITDLVDYSCDVTTDYLERGLADPGRLTFERVRDEFLDPLASSDAPVPMNDMMAATFALVFLDTGHRVLGWLQAQAIDWTRAMVILAGRAGRATAGLTWQTNSMCHMLWQGSGQKLDPERLYIAPFAPALDLAALGEAESAARVEAEFRRIWYSARATVEMGRLMYEGYPAFKPVIESPPVIDATTREVSEMPAVLSANDRRAIITRLRFVMEDQRQQLANASAQYIVDRLVETGNRPQDVVVPGFTKFTYPRRAPRR